MLSTLAFVAILAGPTDFTCAVMGSPAPMKSKSVDYAGLRFPMCCGGCNGTFAGNPAKFIAKAAEDKKTIGYSLFDPVSGAKIDLKELPSSFADHKGVRYFFQTPEGKAAFEKDAQAFSKLPDKEVMYCSVMGHGIDGYAAAGAYADHADVRYYFCCPDCRKQFVGNPAKFAEASKDKVRVAKAADAKAN